VSGRVHGRMHREHQVSSPPSPCVVVQRTLPNSVVFAGTWHGRPMQWHGHSSICGSAFFGAFVIDVSRSDPAWTDLEWCGWLVVCQAALCAAEAAGICVVDLESWRPLVVAAAAKTKCAPNRLELSQMLLNRV
jgi:Tfp pilus assembly protein PilV